MVDLACGRIAFPVTACVAGLVSAFAAVAPARLAYARGDRSGKVRAEGVAGSILIGTTASMNRGLEMFDDRRCQRNLHGQRINARHAGAACLRQIRLLARCPPPSRPYPTMRA